MAYDNEKKFALFKNDKGDNPKRPDYRGEITLNGAVYKMSAWLAEDKKGGKYMRGVVEFDDKKNGTPATGAQSPIPVAQPKPAAVEQAEDVPF
jgi:hypothetical protein